MNFSLFILFIASLSYSLTAQAIPKSVEAPGVFESGPKTAATSIKLKNTEIASLILLEGVFSVASSAVLVSGCQAVEGKYPFKVTADGSINKLEADFSKVNSAKKTEPLVLNATIETSDAFWGWKINVRQSKKSKLKETVISAFSADATLNRDLSLLSMDSEVKILGQRNVEGLYQSKLLKHLYKDIKQNSKSQKIMGWGMVSISEANYPANTFWARFKAIKADGRLKRIVLQQDRLTGASSCRIAIDGTTDIKKQTEKEKKNGFILKGLMTISKAKPRESLSITADF